jgi:hypothetical protein
VAVERFPFAFDPRFVPLLAAARIRTSNSEVVIDDDTFEARFGPFRLTTPTSNLKSVQITRHYRWYKAIGPRWSLADGGATYGTNAREGVCVCFHEQVPAGLVGRRRHPGLTVTVEDPAMLADAVGRRLRNPSP